ncbi:hypothetical protein CTI12_AA281580 [Artemisia annua]|uniref:Uncharacterized protein n=1 Tax=Artemisia annua TaxID=35608 RepID=A0A2U1NCQ8_ARTAN|nr:hypothetical protein CTI12_AA281580 [Artemisia annua]
MQFGELEKDAHHALKKALAHIRVCTRLEALLLKKKVLYGGETPEVHAQKRELQDTPMPQYMSHKGVRGNSQSDGRYSQASTQVNEKLPRIIGSYYYKITPEMKALADVPTDAAAESCAFVQVESEIDSKVIIVDLVDEGKETHFPNCLIQIKHWRSLTYKRISKYKGGPALPRKMASLGEQGQMSVLKLVDSRDKSETIIHISKKELHLF